MTKFSIRTATSADSGFLVDMLMEAMNWLPERNWSRKEILTNPELAHYVTGWMQPGDFGVIAVDLADRPVGAAWCRYLTAADPGYGYVSDDVPELTIGVVESWRNRGVGRALLRAVLYVAHDWGLQAVSLSVERANFAARLYASEGFHTVESFDDADTMVAELAGRRLPGGVRSFVQSEPLTVDELHQQKD
ncbi:MULTISPECIES: GNAT family N-acetyltransferase [Micromonospora]|nr:MULTISPECIES: GNAT family N-acetyltransferase [unclassified Micromonospora]MBM0225243.1 GNAT family N-acetyltransferase [Micromonospora sp. ATA51]